jgi:hypothetical protein
MAQESAFDVIRHINQILFGKDGASGPQRLRLDTGPATAVVELGDLRKVLDTFTPGIDEDVNQAARALAVRAGMESWPGHNGWGARRRGQPQHPR